MVHVKLYGGSVFPCFFTRKNDFFLFFMMHSEYLALSLGMTVGNVFSYFLHCYECIICFYARCAYSEEYKLVLTFFRHERYKEVKYLLSLGKSITLIKRYNKMVTFTNKLCWKVTLILNNVLW